MSTKADKNIVVVGTGAWGGNLVRNFAELGVLFGICDQNPECLKKTGDAYPKVKRYQSFDEILGAAEADAVAIATPAATHYQLCKAALEAGKDVFVEKPAALNPAEAKELAEIIKREQRILMVDHLLLYHPAILRLKDIIDAGKLGKLQYIYSNRLNIGKLRKEENILWSFAPHDIAVILYLTGRQPMQVRAFGEAYLQEDIFDTTVSDLTFNDKLKAHIFVSWLHPYKEQKLVVIGNDGMAVFNDLAPSDQLTFYPHKIKWIRQIPVADKAAQETIPFEPKEPLKEACRHFVNCLMNRQTPQTDIQEAIDVLEVLQSAQEDLEASSR